MSVKKRSKISSNTYPPRRSSRSLSPMEPLSLYLSTSECRRRCSSPGSRKRTKARKDVETSYLNMQKFALALVTTSRKLRYYFQELEIRLITNQSLKKVLHKPKLSGRMINWAMKLSQYTITFLPRTLIKAQACLHG